MLYGGEVFLTHILGVLGFGTGIAIYLYVWHEVKL